MDYMAYRRRSLVFLWEEVIVWNWSHKRCIVYREMSHFTQIWRSHSRKNWKSETWKVGRIINDSKLKGLGRGVDWKQPPPLKKWRVGRKEENFLNKQFFGKFRFLFFLIEFIVITTTKYKVSPTLISHLRIHFLLS